MTEQHFIALADSIRSHNQACADVQEAASLSSPKQGAAPFTIEQVHAGDCGPNGGKRKG